MTRLAGRLRVLPRAAVNRLGARTRPASPRSVLIAHHLLTGDVCMLAPLLAKLRTQYPAARIVMTVRRTLLPLFAGHPYGVRAVAYDPGRPSTLGEIFDPAGYDLAIVPGDNRYSWLAAAAGARWIVAFAGDRPAYKSWPVDEERAIPEQPLSWADMVATLIEGPPPAQFRPGDWPTPPCAPFELPQQKFVVAHVGAGSPLRHWAPENWQRLAGELERRGLAVVWSAGPGEEDVVRRIESEGRRTSYAGKLDLAQLWHLLARAAGLVTLDTGIAHLAKLVYVPSVTLFGPGSPALFGRGEFWRDAPFVEAGLAEFPCRDQQTFFKRHVEWIRRCHRSPAECDRPRCMEAISVEEVLAGLRRLRVIDG